MHIPTISITTVRGTYLLLKKFLTPVGILFLAHFGTNGEIFLTIFFENPDIYLINEIFYDKFT